MQIRMVKIGDVLSCPGGLVGDTTGDPEHLGQYGADCEQDADELEPA